MRNVIVSMGTTENILSAMNRTVTKLAVLLVTGALVAAACGSDDQVTLTQTLGERLAPDLLVRHGETREWTAAVYLDEEARADLVDRFNATVDDYEAAEEAGYQSGDPLDTDRAEIEAIDLGENFIVTDGYYCGDGDTRLEVTPDALLLHSENTTSCEAPQPVSSIWVVPRSAVAGSFTLGEPGSENPVVVDGWEVDGNSTAGGEQQAEEPQAEEPQAELEPLLLVGHESGGTEFPSAVYVHEADRAELIELVEPNLASPEDAIGSGEDEGRLYATDAAEIEAIDLDENFIVLTGYFCLSGSLRLMVEPDVLTVIENSGTDCAQPQPVSSIFVVPRSATSGTFTLVGHYGETEATVEDWVVTG